MGFATKNELASYIVTDQNARTGGVTPLSKWITYLFAPFRVLPSPSTNADGYTASCGRFAPRPTSATTARTPYSVPKLPRIIGGTRQPLTGAPVSFEAACSTSSATVTDFCSPLATAGSSFAG